MLEIMFKNVLKTPKWFVSMEKYKLGQDSDMLIIEKRERLGF